MPDLTIQAKDLTPAHLGREVTVPVGLETRRLYLDHITFRLDRDNTGSGYRVVVTGPRSQDAWYFDLASYAKVIVHDAVPPEPSPNRVFFSPKGGPVHLVSTHFPTLAWCGVREQFRHTERDGDVSEVTCPKCRAAIKADQPRAWRSR